MRYVTLIFAFIAPIWLVKPLWAEEAAVKEAVKYIEDNRQCITIFIVSIEDDFRLPLQFEIDHDYYKSESVKLRFNKQMSFVSQKLNKPLGKVTSKDAQSYIAKKLEQIVNQEYFPIKNLIDENAAIYFDQLYRECIKSFSLDNQ